MQWDHFWAMLIQIINTFYPFSQSTCQEQVQIQEQTSHCLYDFCQVEAIKKVVDLFLYFNINHNQLLNKSVFFPHRFTEFGLGISATCTSNYVDVYNGPNTFAPLLGQFCGSDIPPVLRSINNSIFLVFKTNGFHTFRGWKATYIEISGE